MRVLITGSNGFLGQHLTNQIQTTKPDWKISGFDLQEEVAHQYNYKQLDFNSNIDWKALIIEHEPDYIFHLAGLFRGTEQKMYQTNVHSFERFIEGIRDSEVNSKLIVIGSAAQYGLVEKSDNPIRETHPTNPVNVYGKTKNLQEEIALKFFNEYGINTVCTRPSSFIGKGISHQLLVGYLTSKFRTASKSIDIEISKATDVRDYIDIRDICQALILLQESPNSAGKIFNLSSSNILTNLELVNLFEKVSGKSATISYTSPESPPSEIFLDSRKMEKMTDFKLQYHIEDSITFCLE